MAADTLYASDSTGESIPSWASTNKKYNLGQPAKDLYEHLRKDRSLVEEKARRMAHLTIPSVFPPLGYKTGASIGENNQSINALCVNTLASKLTFMALPPERPILRFQAIARKIQQQLASSTALSTNIRIGLAQLAEDHRERFEATNMRSAYVSAMKQLIVGGNTCWDHMKLDHPVVHGVCEYVVKRNKRGEQQIVIVEQELDLIDADVATREFIYGTEEGAQVRLKPILEQCITFHCVCMKQDDEQGGEAYWLYWEEYEGKLIPGTEFEADLETPPLYAAWMVPVYGQNWGRSYCEEYEGDLMQIEGDSSNLNDGAALAGLSLIFNKPGSRTSTRQLREAENLSVLAGEASDISLFNTAGKQSDLAFVNTKVEAAAKRLGRAFLLVSSMQRNAERVTAEEWKLLAKEIDEATGGLYAELSQTFQRYVIKRAVALHNFEDKDVPKLPQGVFKVQVITGLDATGEVRELENLRGALADVGQFFAVEGMSRIDIDEAVRRIMLGHSVRVDSLVKQPEQLAAEKAQAQKQAMMQNVIDKGTGPAISTFGKSAGPMLQQQAQQQGEQQNDNLGASPPQGA